VTCKFRPDNALQPMLPQVHPELIEGLSTISRGLGDLHLMVLDGESEKHAQVRAGRLISEPLGRFPIIE
jgi:hypothetical protein